MLLNFSRCQLKMFVITKSIFKNVGSLQIWIYSVKDLKGSNWFNTMQSSRQWFNTGEEKFKLLLILQQNYMSVSSFIPITSGAWKCGVWRGLKRSRKQRKYGVLWQERLVFWCRFRYFQRGEGTKVWKRFRIPLEDWWKGNGGGSHESVWVCYSSLSASRRGWLNIQFDTRWVFNSPDTRPEWAAAAVRRRAALCSPSERTVRLNTADSFQRHSTLGGAPLWQNGSLIPHLMTEQKLDHN